MIYEKKVSKPSKFLVHILFLSFSLCATNGRNYSSLFKRNHGNKLFFIHRQNTMNLLDGILLTHCRPVTIFSLISIECNDMQLVNSHSQ